MKKKHLLVIILLFMCILVLTGCNNKNYLKEITYNEYINLKEESKNNNRKFILYVKQEGCPHCTAFTPTVEKVANKYKVQIYYINLTNLTKEDYKLFNSEGFVNGTPTILFFENGEELGSFSRIIGNKSEKTLTNKLIARGYINK